MPNKTPRFKEIEIRNLADALLARHIAGTMAQEIGLSPQRQEDARLITSELAKNHIVHHTKGGVIRLWTSYCTHEGSLNIASLDWGPGIADVDAAVSGQATTDTGLGAGLGTVKRLSDSMDICSKSCPRHPCPSCPDLSPYVTIISSTLWRDPSTPDMLRSMGAELWCCSQPIFQDGYCGDMINIQQDQRYIRIVVADGAGHGKEAQQVSIAAVNQIKKWELLWPVDSILKALVPEILDTRGLAIVLMLIDVHEGSLQITGIGNIKVLLRLIFKKQGCETSPRECWIDVPKIQKGVLGECRWANPPRFDYTKLSQIMAIVHTDGHQDLDCRLIKQVVTCPWPSSILGNALFHPASDPNDDATLMVFRWNQR